MKKIKVANLGCMVSESGLCKSCVAPVFGNPEGRFFIRMGHPGFNSPANNRSGYATAEKAIAAYQRYSNGRKK